MACTTCTEDDEFPARMSLGPIVDGDEWEGRAFTIEVRTSAYGVTPITWGAPATELDEVIMQFHTSEESLDELETLTSVASADIVINVAATWDITVKPITFTALTCPVTQESQSYFWAMRFKPDGLGYQTYLKGTIQIDRKGVV
jgi:hypothetical protein